MLTRKWKERREGVCSIVLDLSAVSREATKHELVVQCVSGAIMQEE